MSGSIGRDTPSCVKHWSLSLHAVIKNLRVVGTLLCNLCWCTRAIFSQKDPDSRPCLQDCKTGDVADCVTHLSLLRWSIHLSAQFPHYQLWKNPVTARPSLVRCPPSDVDQSSFNCPTSYHTFLNWHQVSIKGRVVFLFDYNFFGDKNCIFLPKSRIPGTTQQKLHLTRIARRDHIEEVWTASELGLSARRGIATAGSPILR